ncbi:MAG: hypothetical protein NVSMB1_00360 [Polyangiales bacterium]
MSPADPVGPVRRTKPPARRLSRLYHWLFGTYPYKVWALVVPTLVGIALDVALRMRSLVAFPPKELLNYVGSSLVGAGFWGSVLWGMAHLFATAGRRNIAVARALLSAFFAFVFAPFAFFAYGGQAYYYQVFHAYMSRDTVRLGIELRGTLGAWLAAWGGKLVPAAIAAVLITAMVAFLVRRAATSIKAAVPIIPVLAFVGCTFCLWIGFVETRGLQAAPPDLCFLHGMVASVHDHFIPPKATKGVSLRMPLPLPPLAVSSHRPNVVLVITESVRADAVCSDKSTPCASRFLDEVIPERVSLGKLTSQSSGTFSSCMTLFTGLPPDADFQATHRAPFLFEIARAVGYRTAYITSQNLRYRDLAAYVNVAGIDVQASAVEFGDTKDPHVGAPDERATQRLLEFVKSDARDKPYFAVLHLSNTHWPYRVDESLQPNQPHSEDPLQPVLLLHNHYLNSVLQQERTVSEFLAALKSLPTWGDTVVLFVSDHGEQFREHGGLYHLNTLFDEEVRVPGWLAAGASALTTQQRVALSSFKQRRTYAQDVNATVVDLLGVFDARKTLPLSSMVSGRSLLRPPSSIDPEPEVILSTTSGVWEDDDPAYGVMQGEKLLVGGDARAWVCYDIAADPHEYRALPSAYCGEMIATARTHFPNVPIQ